MARRSVGRRENGESSGARNYSYSRWRQTRVTEMLPEQRENEEQSIEDDDRVEGEQNDTSDHILEHLFDRSVISPAYARSDSKAIDVMFSDIDAMNCHICTEPLSLPIFQCINGHTVCAECHSEIDLCAFCKVELTQYRCHAMEKVLKSLKIACENTSYGCKAVVWYSEKRAHQKSCIFQPWLCPQTGCKFLANSVVLSEHFKTNHQLHKLPFSYNEVFYTSIHFDDSITVLQALTDDKLFIISNNVGNTGNIINLYHIEPNMPNTEFNFKMLVWSQEGGNSLKLKSKAKNIQDCTYTLSSRFLYVPFEYFQPSRRLNLQIRINVVGDVQPGDIPLVLTCFSPGYGI